MIFDKNVAGLYTPLMTYRHPTDKQAAKRYGYRREELPLARWVDCHRRGFAFVAGNMRSYIDTCGRQQFSHQEALWHGTEWAVLDLDDDDIDTHDVTCLPQLCPESSELLFAACESLSANVNGRPARWHGFVLLERPITTRQEYKALLLGLRERLWVLEGVERQPAQMVYGNGRPGAYYELFENVLSESLIQELVEVGYTLIPDLRNPKPQARDMPRTGGFTSRRITRAMLTDYSSIEPPRLREFLSAYQVQVYAGKKTSASRTLYYLPCPFSADHTEEVAATDTYLSVDDEGRWGFGCFHTHCQDRLARAEQLDKTASGWRVFSDAVRCPVRMGLIQVGLKPPCVVHVEEARIYQGIPCPRHSAHRGSALFRHEDKQRIFLCDVEDCEPVGWQEFLQLQESSAGRSSFSYRSLRGCGMTRYTSDVQRLLARAAAVVPVQKPHLDFIQSLPPEHPIFKIADEHRGPAYVPRGSSFRYFTAEERQLVREILPRHPDAGYVAGADGEFTPIFTPRFPFPLNGQPPEAEKRRVYCTLYGRCEADGCDGRVAWWIDRYYLTAGRYCEACHQDIPTEVDSWASLQWKRRPANAIESDFEGFIGNDPLLEQVSLWHPNSVFLLGSGMRTGKTTHLFAEAARLVQENPARKFVYLGARVSQVRGIWAEFSGEEEPSDDMRYGLFCHAVDWDYKRIGTHGAIATISSLPQVLELLGDDAGAGIFLAIDEVDFGVGLMNASIMKSLKPDNKALLQRCLCSNGIVVAGQTETTLALEAFARELGIPEGNVTGYFKRGHLSATATIYEYPHVEGMRGRAVARVRERCQELMSAGKRPYVFCQGRRTAEILASVHEGALILDAYRRGDIRIMEMLYQQETEAPLVVFSSAADVGISLKDPDGYSIVLMEENPQFLNSVASTAQQGVRDRNDADREFHILSFENSLPAAPSFYARVGEQEMLSKLHADEASMEPVASHLATRRGLDEHSDSQPTDYLQFQLEYAGLAVVVLPAVLPAAEQEAEVAELRKASLERERRITAERAWAILHHMESCYLKESTGGVVDVRGAFKDDAPQSTTRYNAVLSGDDIRSLGSRGMLHPAPFEQLSHELALQASLAVGYAVPSREERAQFKREQEAAWQASVEAGYDDFGDEAFEDIDDFDDGAQDMDETQLAAAVAYLDAGILYDRFQRQALGFLSVHHNEVVHAIFNRELGETTHRVDYRARGGLLTSLLRHLPSGVFSFEELADAVETALQERYGDDRFFDMVKSGALGDGVAKAFRFITLASPLVGEKTPEDSRERLVEWVCAYLPRYYPCRISRTRGRYQFLRDSQWETKLACIECQLRYQHGLEDDAVLPQHEDIMPATGQRADAFAAEKRHARELRRQGQGLNEIAQAVGISVASVKRAVQGMRKGYTADSIAGRVLACLANGEVWTKKALAENLDIEPRSLTRPLQKLHEREEIWKVGRGKYRER